MRQAGPHLGLWIGLVLLAGLAAQPAPAQRRFGQGQFRTESRLKKHPAPLNDPEREGPKKEGHGNLRGMMGLPPKWIERLQEMSPEEQERFMKNNAHFQSFEPRRQAEIRRRLQHWNSLTPSERNALRDRQRVWEQMTPEQRDYVRHNLLPQWQRLPRQRKQLLIGRLRILRGMSESEREANLNDEEFLRGLDLNEQQILRGLNTLRNPPNP